MRRCYWSVVEGAGRKGRCGFKRDCPAHIARGVVKEGSVVTGGVAKGRE